MIPFTRKEPSLAKREKQIRLIHDKNDRLSNLTKKIDEQQTILNSKEKRLNLEITFLLSKAERLEKKQSELNILYTEQQSLRTEIAKLEAELKNSESADGPLQKATDRPESRELIHTPSVTNFANSISYSSLSLSSMSSLSLDSYESSTECSSLTVTPINTTNFFSTQKNQLDLDEFDWDFVDDDKQRRHSI